MGGRTGDGFYVPVVLKVAEFKQVSSAAAGFFPGHPLEWTSDQKKCFEVWRTYEIFRNMPIPLESRPPEYIINTWDRLVLWIESYNERAMAEAMVRVGNYTYLSQPQQYGSGEAFDVVEFKDSAQ